VAGSAAAADRSDQAYCEKLSDLYIRYIGHDLDYGRPGYYQRGSTEAQVAVAQCRAGNPAPAIPVLERTLRDNKFTLPSRG
jgi:hypothetical protein